MTLDGYDVTTSSLEDDKAVMVTALYNLLDCSYSKGCYITETDITLTLTDSSTYVGSGSGLAL